MDDIRTLHFELQSRIARVQDAQDMIRSEFAGDVQSLQDLDIQLDRLLLSVRSATQFLQHSVARNWASVDGRIVLASPSGHTRLLLAFDSADASEPSEVRFRLTAAQLDNPASRGSRLELLAAQSDALTPVRVPGRDPASFRLVYRYLHGDLPVTVTALRVLLQELDWWGIDAGPVRAKLLQHAEA